MCDNKKMLTRGRFTDSAHARAARARLEKGSAAVEFALVLPLFCAVIFGTIDYGWYFYQRFTLTAAVRDGLRTGVTISQNVASPNDCSTVARTRAAADMVQAGLTAATISNFSTTTGNSFPTKTMTLTGTYTFTPLVNFVPLPAHGMTYSMTMMYELQQ
jgi:Flp pilus assembly protein TadG